MLARLLLVLATCAACASAPAAEIVLETSAVEKLLLQALFGSGRYELRRGACYAYLDSPTVQVKDGRLRLRSRIVSFVGAEVGGSCIGAPFSAWTVVSGRPAARGGQVQLDDLRVDNVDDAATRALLEALVVPALPRAFAFDVQQAVRDMLQNAAPQLQATLQAFTIESVKAADDRLSIRFDFRLAAQ